MDNGKIQWLNILSSRETEIIACLYFGSTSKEIARFLSTPSKEISSRTIDKHVENVLHKLGFYRRNFLKKYVEQTLSSNEISNLREIYLKLSEQTSDATALEQESTDSENDLILANTKATFTPKNYFIKVLFLSLVTMSLLLTSLFLFQRKQPLVKSKFCTK